MDNLYTLMVEYRGGTYVWQIKASSTEEALLRWANTQERQGRKGLGSRVRLEIRKQLDNDNGPVALKGCRNVWCQTGVFRDQLVLIHVVRTCA